MQKREREREREREIERREGKRERINDHFLIHNNLTIVAKEIDRRMRFSFVICSLFFELHLSWRPSHWSSTDDVKMQPSDSLATVLALVHDHPIPVVADAFLAGDLGANLQQVPQKLLLLEVADLEVAGPADGGLGNHQDVRGCLRVVVVEGHH